MTGEKKGQWQWQDKDGRWRDHTGETSDKIEHVYQTRHGKGTVVVECENEKWVPAPQLGGGCNQDQFRYNRIIMSICVYSTCKNNEDFLFFLVYTSCILVCLGLWIIINHGYWPGKLSDRAHDLIILQGSQVWFLAQTYIYIVYLLIPPFLLQINTLLY